MHGFHDPTVRKVIGELEEFQLAGKHVEGHVVWTRQDSAGLVEEEDRVERELVALVEDESVFCGDVMPAPFSSRAEERVWESHQRLLERLEYLIPHRDLHSPSAYERLRRGGVESLDAIDELNATTVRELKVIHAKEASPSPTTATFVRPPREAERSEVASSCGEHLARSAYLK